MPLLLFLLCILITITSPHAHAATRLGLHVTTEEKAVWNARRTDTVGNIGGVTYKTMWDTRILPDANTFKAQGHPGGDGLWDGWTAAGCFPNGQRDTSFRPNGTKMMKSAFVFLVTGDTTYAAGVASNLLAQIAKAGTDWTNAGKWCRNIDNTVTMIDYLPWLTRLLYAYDYLIAGGYTGFTAANKTAIQTWFVNAALYWEHVVTTTVEKRYSTARNTPPSYAVCDGVACPGGDISPTHWNSTNIARSFSTAWHNPTSLTASLMGSVGVLANHAGLKNSATLFYKEFLRFSTWADGSIHDQSRWDDVPNVSNGVIRAWSHIYMQLQPMILLADHFARNNDASLYTYQSPGGQFGTGGGNVDLLTVVRWFSRMENNTLTPKVYGANIIGAVGEATRLQSKAQDFAREPVQIGNAMANIRFKNAEIETAYSGVLGANSGCGGFGGCSSGAWGLIPDMLFQFGNQETMDPYTLGAVTPAPIVVINVPSSATDYSSHIPVTTVSGTITGTNIASVVWHCDNCVVTDNTATFTPPSTFVVNGLQTNLGVNTVTITATNTSGLVGTDQITITLTTPGPDPTTGMIYRLAFEEGMGSSVIDSTGTQGPTSLTGGFSWQPGLFGAYAVQFDGTGVGTLPGLLGAPVSVTIQGHVQLTGPGDIEGGTLLNIGNYVGVRVYPGRIRAFYLVAGSTYSGLDFFTTLGAGWNHIAYTHNSTERKLYLNGFEVASASSSPLVWTGQGVNTTIARQAQGLTNYDLQGKLDDVRVYNRALSQADIQASIVGVPSPPLITITSPTTTGTFSTSSNTVSLSGSVSDNVAVASVTVSCPQCNPALVDSAATVSGSTWSKNSIVLGTAPSTNVFTVEATDNEGAQALTQLTVTRTVIPVTEGPACTRWASNNGSGDGLTIDTPYTISQYWAQSGTAKVLCLHDGTYTGVNNMITPSTGIAGTSLIKIVVRALFDGKVLIDGQNIRTPVFLSTTNQHIVVSGINAMNGLTDVFNIAGDNNLLQRTIGWNGTSGQINTRIYNITGTNSLAEDCAAWGNNVRVLFQGSLTVSKPGVAFRRCFGEWNDHPEGGNTKGAVYLPGVDQHLENVIGTVNKTGP